MRIIHILLSIILISFTIDATAQSASERLVREGVSLHDKGDYEGAIKKYQQVLKTTPNSMPATYEMSLSYLRLKNYDEAIKYSSAVIDHNYQPLLTDAYIVKSSALAKGDNIDGAIELLEEALIKCGESYLLHFNIGLCSFNNKNTEKALSHLERAIEIDATHAGSFLLYAYALNDANKWVQSFYAFHFFLLLEPNTPRSKDAFMEMYDLVSVKIPNDSPRLAEDDGINRRNLYETLLTLEPRSDNMTPQEQYEFFEKVSRAIFFTMSNMQTNDQSGLLWTFFVPIYSEILQADYLDVYSRYVSAAYFPESLEWWNNNKEEVDDFINWFENGESGSTNSEEAQFEDEDGQFVDGPHDAEIENAFEDIN